MPVGDGELARGCLGGFLEGGKTIEQFLILAEGILVELLHLERTSDEIVRVRRALAIWPLLNDELRGEEREIVVFLLERLLRDLQLLARAFLHQLALHTRLDVTPADAGEILEPVIPFLIELLLARRIQRPARNNKGEQ